MTDTDAMKRELRAAILKRDSPLADRLRMQLREAGVSIYDTRRPRSGVTYADNAERAIQHDQIQRREARP